MEVLMHEASSNVNINSNFENRNEERRSNNESTTEQVAKISHRIKEDCMEMEFEDITYSVSLGFHKGTKEILHSVNGRFPAKQLIAIMGPSGAGKSTLLDILSGYRITGVTGAVYINGRERDLNSFRRSSAYITQDDRLQPLLTVLESMRVSADLKLGTDTSRFEKEAIIEDILTTLGLYEHKSTIAGRLSGGQKKRLSIALELVNDPTILFLDEPTTGLDSSSCMQVVKLLQLLAQQGRTIICTIHQPSASLFQLFDQTYILARGKCLFQGSTTNLVPYLKNIRLPCPIYHNPADYVIELSCGEYGEDKIDTLVEGTQNGKSLQWFKDPSSIKDSKSLRELYPLKEFKKGNTGNQATSQMHQISILLWRGMIKIKRDQTLTHLRILVNVVTGLMLGSVYVNSGNAGSRVFDNYNLLFGILIHHMMSTMMLTILTFPSEMNILQKEHFNRWYSLKAFFVSVNIIDIPIHVLCCLIFTLIVYLLSDQPHDLTRFNMFFVISLLVSFVAMSFGLTIGIIFDVVNGTFLGPTLSVPMMMFAGFGVTIRDLPVYLKWGSHISYLRYGLEGYVGAIYGLNRDTLDCDTEYCHYKYPDFFLRAIDMKGDQFWNDVIALTVILITTRFVAYVCLRWRLKSDR